MEPFSLGTYSITRGCAHISATHPDHSLILTKLSHIVIVKITAMFVGNYLTNSKRHVRNTTSFLKKKPGINYIKSKSEGLSLTKKRLYSSVDPYT